MNDTYPLNTSSSSSCNVQDNKMTNITDSSSPSPSSSSQIISDVINTHNVQPHQQQQQSDNPSTPNNNNIVMVTSGASGHNNSISHQVSVGRFCFRSILY